MYGMTRRQSFSPGKVQSSVERGFRKSLDVPLSHIVNEGSADVWTERPLTSAAGRDPHARSRPFGRPEREEESLILTFWCA